MAFPTTGILDNFNRADEGSPPSASWTDQNPGLKVISNQCGGDTGTNISYWNAATFGPDTECYQTIVVASLANAVFARGSDWGTGGDYYSVHALTWENKVRIYRRDNAVGTELGTGVAQIIANGDQVGIEVVGSTIKSYYNDGGAGWAVLDTQIDDTYTGAGNIGAYIEDATERIDDFGGGTIISGGGQMSAISKFWGPSLGIMLIFLFNIISKLTK